VVKHPCVHESWVGRVGTVEEVYVNSFGHGYAMVRLDGTPWGLADAIEFPFEALAQLLH
jgi:hypothetical protein